MNNYFMILETEFKDLAELGSSIQSDVLTSPHLAIVNSRLFAEKLIEHVAEKEKIEYIISLKQVERIQYLSREGIITRDIIDALNDVRIIGNKAIHTGKDNDMEYSIRIHKRLYQIVCWFVETYGSDFSVQMPEYKYPEVNNNVTSVVGDELQDIVKEQLERLLPGIYQKINIEKSVIAPSLEMADQNLDGVAQQKQMLDIKKDAFEFKRLRNSYLLNELTKLGDFSQEAVESYESLSQLKKYMHVNRTIQKELLDLLKKSKEKEGAQLIIMAGNVGDGKSHLLAYLNEEYKEIMSSFKIHNDATESFDPQLTEIDTLKQLLEPFSDGNIRNSNEKLILAINLGVLHNFLNTKEAKEEYTRLASFIMKSGVFDQDKTSSNIIEEHFNLVSFGDYNIYELTDKGPQSDFISSLLYKITSKESENPFYQAYQLDIEAGLKSPVLLNYQILCEEGVVNRITQLIIASMVKSKKILGTRELLNLIYEMLVPANISSYDQFGSFSDNLEALLPNMLFHSEDRGLVLRLIGKEDPVQYRHEEMDRLLIMINIAANVERVVMPYFQERKELINTIFEGFYEFHNYSKQVQEESINTVVRLLYLLGDEKMQTIFCDKTYCSYMEYLYFYNKGEGKGYRNILEEVKRAVFNWNGSPKTNYIHLNDELVNFKIAEKLEFKASAKKGVMEKVQDNILERFKSTLTLGYEIVSSGEVETIEVDYQLYKIIRDINAGYYANKKDREEALVLIEFVEKLLSQGSMGSELVIQEQRDKLWFELRYEDDFDEVFIFERLDK